MMPLHPQMKQPLFQVLEQERRSNIDWQPEAPPSLKSKGIKEIYLDCETTGLEWWNKALPIGIALGFPEANGKLVFKYYPWGHKGGGNLDENVMFRWAQTELCGIHIVNHTTRFDIHEMFQWGVDLEAQGCTVSDISHTAALIDDYRRVFALEQLGQDFLGQGKVKGLDLDRMEEYHAGEVAEYAAQDVRLVAGLKKILYPMLEEQGLMGVQRLEDDVIFPVCEMERNGAPLDLEKLQQWNRESEHEYFRLLWLIYKESGERVNPGSPTDMNKLFRKLKIPITKFTEKGAPSFADEVLEKIDHPIVQICRKAQQIAELRKRYLVPYSKYEDGTLRYNLHQVRTDKYGTNRGRFSASQEAIQGVLSVEKQTKRYGPDYMIRKLFIPGSGLWFSADAAQIEFRIFAHYANSKRLLDAYEKDPTTSFHEFVWDIVKQFRPDFPYKKLKIVNFSKIYGASNETVAEELELPIAETNSFVNIYDRNFPDVRRLLRLASDVAKQRGWVHTLLGRRARFPGGHKAHAALNAIIQGTAADIMKRKLVELYRERKRLNLTLRMTVHDEVCGDCPDQETAKLVAEILNQQTTEMKVPILWDIKAGANWAECA